MEKRTYTVISGSGSYIPGRIVSNDEFLKNQFYSADGSLLAKSNEEIVQKFKQITDIHERRYADDTLVSSDMGFLSAEDLLKQTGIDKESLDYIIVAHNFGDVRSNNPQVDILPSLASRIKAKLGISNPNTVAYDLPFGCPGWLQGVIQADYYIRSGDAKRIMVIASETLSRISDPHDVDSMIYSDGAGAVLLEAKESETPVGIISHKTRTDVINEVDFLKMGPSYKPSEKNNRLFLKMNGRKLYEYALNTVPQLVKDCIEKSGLFISDFKKVLIHQANAKMDEAILKRIFRLFGSRDIPDHIMPMTISKLGNNSVATLPILLDKLLKREMPDHIINTGDHLVFASVGAGMNVNSLVYKMV